MRREVKLRIRRGNSPEVYAARLLPLNLFSWSMPGLVGSQTILIRGPLRVLW